MSEQLVDIIRPPVGETVFGQAPHRFVRIELGSISWKVLEVQTREPAAKVTDRIALVNPALVPQHDDVAGQVAQEVAEELAHVRVFEVRLLSRICG